MAPCVLYIEDNIDNLILVRRVLTAAGMKLLEATSAQAGIDLAVQAQPDLILIDINMPDVDGIMATAQLRQIPTMKHIPIVAVTANIMRGVLDRALEAGCDGYISKPIKIDEFPEQVMRFLNNGRK